MPQEGTKKKKLEWEKYKFDAPEGTWKKKKKKKKIKKSDCTPGSLPGRDIIFPTAVPDPQYILPIRL